MKSMRRTAWSTSDWLLVVITLAGAFLRFYRLDAQSFWGDEALSSLIAASSVSDIWSNAFGSANPEGYYMLLHFWMSLAGETDLALRCLSALLGVLSIVLMYQLGKSFRSKRLGLWAAGITTVTPYHVFYSQETRMYMLLYCLTCITVLAYTRWWQGYGRHHWWIVYFLAAVAGLWTHFFAGFVVAALAIHFFLVRLWPRFATTASPPSWSGFAVTHGAIASAFLLYVTHFAQRLLIVKAWRPLPSLSDLTGLPLTFTTSQFLGGAWQTIALGCVTFLVIVVGLQAARALWRGSPASEWLLLLGLLLVTPVMASFTVSQIWKPVFTARVLIIVVPALYLLVAWSAAHTRERHFNQLILALLLPQMMLGLHNWFFDPSFAKPLIRDAVRLVQDLEPTDAPVLHAIAESYMVFEHYAPSVENCLLSDPVQPRVGKRIDPADVSYQRFWFVILPTYAHESQLALLDDLDSRFERRQERSVGGVQLYLYVSDEPLTNEIGSASGQQSPI